MMTPTGCSFKGDVPDHEGYVHKPAIADILIVGASLQSGGPTGPSMTSRLPRIEGQLSNQSGWHRGPKG
jgi:hypothetical protein